MSYQQPANQSPHARDARLEELVAEIQRRSKPFVVVMAIAIVVLLCTGGGAIGAITSPPKGESSTSGTAVVFYVLAPLSALVVWFCANQYTKQLDRARFMVTKASVMLMRLGAIVACVGVVAVAGGAAWVLGEIGLRGATFGRILIFGIILPGLIGVLSYYRAVRLSLLVNKDVVVIPGAKLPWSAVAGISAYRMPDQQTVRVVVYPKEGATFETKGLPEPDAQGIRTYTTLQAQKFDPNDFTAKVGMLGPVGLPVQVN